MLIIPTYNEKDNIKSLVEKIRAAAGDVPILFVDDNSPDGTGDVIREIQSFDPQVFLMARPEKAGLGSAYRDAFARVIAENLADFVVEMDADFSHPPEALPEFIEKLKDHAVVVGSRYHPEGRVKNWNWFRRLVSYVGNLYARIFTGVPVSDLTSGMVGYKVSALKKIDLSNMSSEGYAFQIEIKTLLHRAGEKIHEHPITFIERREGRSKFSAKIIMEGMFYPVKAFIMRWGANSKAISKF